MAELRVHYDLIFADADLGSMVIARNAETGEILGIGVDLARP